MSVCTVGKLLPGKAIHALLHARLGRSPNQQMNKCSMSDGLDCGNINLKCTHRGGCHSGMKVGHSTEGMSMATLTPPFKENTGFCLLCRQWKLLLLDSHQPSGKRGRTKSSYCIKCANDLRQAAAQARLAADHSVMKSHNFPGHEERLATHAARVQREMSAPKRGAA